jgi:hypothetical protein
LGRKKFAKIKTNFYCIPSSTGSDASIMKDRFSYLSNLQFTSSRFNWNLDNYVIIKRDNGGDKMKFFINLLPLLLVILGILNYMYFAKDIVITVILLSLGVIVSIFNLIKKKYTIALISISIVIGLVGLFSHLVNSGI